MYAIIYVIMILVPCFKENFKMFNKIKNKIYKSFFSRT